MSGILQISEFLPNPVGSDSTGEWVELHNLSDEKVFLSGWRLKNSSGKTAELSGFINPHEFRIFPRSETRLILKNKQEDLQLFNSDGRLTDSAFFLGEAPEGKSLSRVGDVFIPSQPTPGEANIVSATAPGTRWSWSTGSNFIVKENNNNLPIDIISGFILAVLFCWIGWFTIRKSHDLSHLFFE